MSRDAGLGDDRKGGSTVGAPVGKRTLVEGIAGAQPAHVPPSRDANGDHGVPGPGGRDPRGANTEARGGALSADHVVPSTAPGASPLVGAAPVARARTDGPMADAIVNAGGDAPQVAAARARGPEGVRPDRRAQRLPRCRAAITAPARLPVLLQARLR